MEKEQRRCEDGKCRVVTTLPADAITSAGREERSKAMQEIRGGPGRARRSGVHRRATEANTRLVRGASGDVHAACAAAAVEEAVHTLLKEFWSKTCGCGECEETW